MAAFNCSMKAKYVVFPRNQSTLPILRLIPNAAMRPVSQQKTRI